MVHIEKKIILKRLVKAAVIFLRYSTFAKLVNLLKVECERAFKKQVISGRPYFIKLQPTNICDAGCKYCLRSTKPSSLAVGKMALADCRKAIDKLKKYAYLIGFQYYGEPLFNDSIFEMIAYAHNSKIGTYLSTNLQNLKNEDYAKLANCGLDLLTISIDGITQETYAKYREKGNLAQVIANIRGLLEAKRKMHRGSPFISLQFIVMKHNQHEIKAARQLARELGVDNVEFKPVGTDDKSLLPDNAELYRRAYRKNAQLKRQPCWWLWGSLVVLWDGHILPCCHIVASKTDLNIFQDDVLSIINNPFNQEIRKIKNPGILADVHPCHNCVIPYGNLLQQTL